MSAHTFLFLTPSTLLSYGLAPRPCVDADNDGSVAALWLAVLFDHVIDYRPFPLHINPAAHRTLIREHVIALTVCGLVVVDGRHIRP